MYELPKHRLAVTVPFALGRELGWVFPELLFQLLLL